MRETEWTNKINVEVKRPQPHHSTTHSNQWVKQVESQEQKSAKITDGMKLSPLAG